MKQSDIIRDAVIEGEHRLILYRTWANYSDPRHALFVMLNPSTADAEQDDPTVRRCMGFAEAWGFQGIKIMNLFTHRTASPAELVVRLNAREVGPWTDEDQVDLIREVSLNAARTICAWGNHGELYPERVRMIHGQLTHPVALKLNANGQPGHPLYLPKALQPNHWMLPTYQLP